MLTKHMEKKIDGNYTRMLQAILNESWGQHKTAAVRITTTHHKKLSKLDEPDMWDTAGDVRMNS